MRRKIISISLLVFEFFLGKKIMVADFIWHISSEDVDDVLLRISIYTSNPQDLNSLRMASERQIDGF